MSNQTSKMVTRYSNWCAVTHGHEMMAKPDGSWVLFADYQIAIAELAAKIEAVRAAAIEITRFPLALVAVCKLCGERTDSSSVHRMDPEPRHKTSCALNQNPKDQP